MKAAKPPKLAPIEAISKALEPAYDIICRLIFDDTKGRVEKIFAKVESEENHNFQKVFPYPNSNQGRNSYVIAKHRYYEARFWMKLDEEATVALCTKIDHHRHSFNHPEVRNPIPAWEEIVAKKADEEARASLDGYGYKLSEKVRLTFPGLEVTTCTYSGSTNPWSTSHLSVTFSDGSVAIFNTKMILNRSVLGKLFNQFPTRLTK